MFVTYILKSVKNSSYYTGSTNNLKARIWRHNNGLSKFTKKNQPWIIVYSEVFNTRSEAMKREQEIKSWKSRQQIEKLITNQGPVV